MKVVAFNGSPHKEGNTFLAIQMVAKELIKQGIEVEIVQVGKKEIRGCIACNWCRKHHKHKCVFDDDPVNDWIKQMKKADGIILASPVYFAGINGTLKSFLDRAGYALSQTPGVLRYKVGVGLVALRRTGGMTALNELNQYIQSFEMITPSSSYWNVMYGMKRKQAPEDVEGQQIMQTLGKNMAWLMQVIDQGRKHIPLPAIEEKIFPHFIR